MSFKKPRQSICLTMIVKNESKVIERCIDSVKACISAWVIVDTGSTDGTPDIIQRCLKDIPGQLYHHPWVDFSTNRNQALTYAKDKADYMLIIDADEVLVFEDSFAWIELAADSYSVKTRYGAIDYYRVQLLKSGLNWAYQGVLHEYVTAPDANVHDIVHDVYTIPRQDGARSCDPNKYKKDALLLEKILLDEPGNSRYVFYLAQSYRDAKEYDLAIRYYTQRSNIIGFDEEVWYSLYQIGLIQAIKGENWDIVQRSLLTAYNFRPQRAEPLQKLAEYYRTHHQFNTAYLFAKMGCETPYPEQDILFIERDVYAYKMAQEYGSICFRTNRYSEAIEAYTQVLSSSLAQPIDKFEALQSRTEILDVLYSQTSKIGAPLRILAVLSCKNDDYLDNAISQFLRQDYPYFQVILVDDGNIPIQKNQLPKGDSRFRVIRKKSGFSLSDLEKEITRSQSDIVMIFPDSSWLSTHHMLSQLNNWYQTREAWVVTGQYRTPKGQLGNMTPCPASDKFQDYCRHSQQGIFSFQAEKMLSVIRELQVANPNSSSIWTHVTLMAPIMTFAGFDKTQFFSDPMTINLTVQDFTPISDITDIRQHSNPAVSEQDSDFPRILILTPVKDAEPFLKGYFNSLTQLSYPHIHISIGLLESDSRDHTFEAIEKQLPELRQQFASVCLWKKDFGFHINRAYRHLSPFQEERRIILAKSRNYLLSKALDDEDWVLWLDVDVCEYPHDIIQTLLATKKEILQPNCVLDYNGESFDKNAWRSDGTLFLHHLKHEGFIVPLDAVGGTMLLVKADLHREGLIFPPLNYGVKHPKVRKNKFFKGEIETEGLALMADDMGIQCWGMPHIEIKHHKS